jgi:uncharacterized protein YebE (UPF0316 family)
MTTEMLLAAGLIFILRVVNNAIGTVRLVLLARQQRLLTAVLGFFEALVFAITIAGVVTDFSNILNLLAYCGGFAVGSWVGMAIESRFLTSFMIVNIFSNERGHDIALALRANGYGVTELGGEGHQGKVTMLRSVVSQRDAPALLKVVRETNDDAFVAIEQARSVQGGWLRPARNQPM